MSTLLVTGASGHLGRRVVEHLLDRKAGTVIAGTRDPAKVADLAAKGAEVRVIDFDKPETLAEGLKGVDRLLLVSTDSLQTRTAQQVRLVEAAAKAGVKHVVYTSAPAPRPTAKSLVADSHYWTEQALAASTLGLDGAPQQHLRRDHPPWPRQCAEERPALHRDGQGRAELRDPRGLRRERPRRPSPRISTASASST